MASSFPTSLDAFTNPSSTDALDSVSVPHATQHSDLNDAVEALEAKVGADGSAVVSSHDYKIAQLEAGATGGRILQVQSTTKTDTFSTTSTSYTDVTGLSVTITPTSATSNILVMYDVATSQSTVTNGLAFQMVRDSTAIGGGTAAGSRISASKSMRQPSGYVNAVSGSHLDSPATTSATTYKVQMIVESGMTGYVNRSAGDTNITNPNHARTSSTITVMEVSA